MDDLISRQMAIAAIQNLYPGMPRVNVCDHLNKWREKNKEYIECEEIIKELPSIQSEQRKGKWIVTGTFDDFLKCSCCGYKTPWNQDVFSFCPHCGVKMGREE